MHYNSTIHELIDRSVKIQIEFDKEIHKIRYNSTLSYTPIRPHKSIRLLKKMHVGRIPYALLDAAALAIFPIYFLLKALFISFKAKSKKFNIQKQTLVLKANSTILRDFKKNSDKDHDLISIIGRQPNSESSLYQFMTKRGVTCSFYQAVTYVLRFGPSYLKSLNVLQTWVAFELALHYYAMEGILNKYDEVHIGNHHDRWVVLINAILKKPTLVIHQHGVLYPVLPIEPKFNRITKIYTFDEKSSHQFSKFIDLKKVQLISVTKKIEFTSDKTTNSGKSILVIGQPHSYEKEIGLIRILIEQDDISVLVKPHPLFKNLQYDDINPRVHVLNKNEFPKVHVALSDDSTLGVEYEQSGVKVVWWEGKSVESCADSINSCLI